MDRRDPESVGLVNILDENNERQPELYKKMLKEYYNEYLSHSVLKGKVVFILYDQWFGDRRYRRNISKQLGLTFSDAGLNQILPVGYGSSFDKRKFDGRAQQMDVLNRWQRRVGWTYLDYIQADTELMKLSETIFGHLK